MATSQTQISNPIPGAPFGEAIEQLHRRRQIWNEKYAIRACYEKWHRLIRQWTREGKTLEVGAGAGLMKELWGEGLVATDLLPTPWIDFPLDALNMNLPEASYDNLLCIDAIHHFPNPHRFIDEATKVVKDGGRMIFLEPWISPLSFIFYGLMHHEKIWFKGYQHPKMAKTDPWTGNPALPNLVFGKEKETWPSRHPQWRRILFRRFGLLDFQVAGGFKPWALTRSRRIYDLCLKIDDGLSFLMPLVAFRVLVVYERLPRDGANRQSSAEEKTITASVPAAQ